IILMSAVFLREQVDVSRWAAILFGFLGVLLIVRPGSEVFDPAALLPIFSALTYAISQIIARKIAKDVSTPVMTFHANNMYILGGLTRALACGGGSTGSGLHKSLAFLVRGWVTPSIGDLLLMAACG